jgi:hypothetical protein
MSCRTPGGVDIRVSYVAGRFHERQARAERWRVAIGSESWRGRREGCAVPGSLDRAIDECQRLVRLIRQKIRARRGTHSLSPARGVGPRLSTLRESQGRPKHRRGARRSGRPERVEGRERRAWRGAIVLAIREVGYVVFVFVAFPSMTLVHFPSAPCVSNLKVYAVGDCVTIVKRDFTFCPPIMLSSV